MSKIIKKYNYIFFPLLFISLPIFLLNFGTFEARTILKDALSIFVIVSMFLMLSQFYMVQGNKNIISVHKLIGYIFIPILILHPFFIVLPRFFEAGIEPLDAFVQMITTFNLGVILGIIAWFLMLFLGLTSMFRFRLGIQYKTWKLFHGILSIAFISVAIFHAINLGRHVDKSISIIMIFLVLIGSIIFVEHYLHVKNKETNL